jgi:hypothetical protein
VPNLGGGIWVRPFVGSLYSISRFLHLFPRPKWRHVWPAASEDVPRYTAGTTSGVLSTVRLKGGGTAMLTWQVLAARAGLEGGRG